jgi:hypothetical protein
MDVRAYPGGQMGPHRNVRDAVGYHRRTSTYLYHTWFGASNVVIVHVSDEYQNKYKYTSILRTLAVKQAQDESLTRQGQTNQRSSPASDNGVGCNL